ncbi:hypothetical protein JA1_001577 [Spathaspora sp. JA1]|nr:hypothetical protein JA1_001577 [Spathaspora sp. JA1]
MLRREFNSKLLELFDDEISQLRKQDQEKIQDLQIQINKLNQTISEKDQEISRLKSQLKPRQPSSPKVNDKFTLSLTRSGYDISPSKTEDISPARRAQSMIEDRPILPTQYSEDEEEEAGGAGISDKISPIKISPSKKRRLVSSQGSIIISPKRKVSTNSLIGKIPKLINSTLEPEKSSPIKPTQYSSSSPVSSQYQEEEIEDSQEEAGEEDDFGLGQLPIIPIPKTITTILQKRKYLLNYYTDRFNNEPTFNINLVRHPINEITWDFADFKLNPNYNPPAKSTFLHNHKIINQNQYNKVKAFYQATNMKNNPDFEDSFEDKLSQIFDKFASPPGFMNSEFPNTQELQSRREILTKRQNKRLARRIKECTCVDDKKRQIGEFVFGIDILNSYVTADRWFIK